MQALLASHQAPEPCGVLLRQAIEPRARAPTASFMTTVRRCSACLPWVGRPPQPGHRGDGRWPAMRARRCIVTLATAVRRGGVGLAIATATFSTGINFSDARLREDIPLACFVATRFGFEGKRVASLRDEFTWRGASQPCVAGDAGGNPQGAPGAPPAPHRFGSSSESHFRTDRRSSNAAGVPGQAPVGPLASALRASLAGGNSDLLLRVRGVNSRQLL